MKGFLSQFVLNSRRLSLSEKGNHYTAWTELETYKYVGLWFNMTSFCLLLMTDWQGQRQARLYCHSIKQNSHQSCLLCHSDSHILFLASITAKKQRLLYSDTVQYSATFPFSFGINGYKGFAGCNKMSFHFWVSHLKNCWLQETGKLAPTLFFYLFIEYLFNDLNTADKVVNNPRDRKINFLYFNTLHLDIIFSVQVLALTWIEKHFYHSIPQFSLCKV